MSNYTQKHIISAIYLIILSIICGVLCSCAPVGPDFTKPEVEVHKQWSRKDQLQQVQAELDLTDWWTAFRDPVLDDLVAIAQKSNTSLEISALRVLEARAQLGIATGSLYPQSQFVAGKADYLSPPENTGATSNYWSYTLGSSIAWEIDFWGKFRRGVQSADAAYMASIAAYDQALILLTAQVVDTYISYRVSEEQLRIAYENIKLQERSYNIAQVLFENGDSSELDVQQAHTLLLSTKATVPNLETQRNTIRNILGNLLGLLPGQINASLEKATSFPELPEQFSIGIPADMLRNRPDVRQAEMLAMSQSALVGVAKAGLFPSFSLSGSIGLAAGSPSDSNFGNLFDSNALTYSIGPSFVWPFLNYGRIKNNVRVQDARLQQALINYRDVVLRAARDAENAMEGFLGARKQTTILLEAVDSAKRSTDLSTYRYSEGFSDYQRVLNSQQALFTQQQRLISSEEAAFKNLIELYTSLGGGWQGQDKSQFVSSKTLQVMQERTNWGDLIDRTMAPAVEKAQYRVDW